MVEENSPFYQPAEPWKVGSESVTDERWADAGWPTVSESLVMHGKTRGRTGVLSQWTITRKKTQRIKKFVKCVSSSLRKSKKKWTKHAKGGRSKLKRKKRREKRKRESRKCAKRKASLGGLEPPTFRLTAERANRLRHRDRLEQSCCLRIQIQVDLPRNTLLQDQSFFNWVHSTFFSKTLLDFKKSVSRSICVKFSGKTPGALFLTRICSFVWLFLV